VAPTPEPTREVSPGGRSLPKEAILVLNRTSEAIIAAWQQGEKDLAKAMKGLPGHYHLTCAPQGGGKLTLFVCEHRDGKPHEA
jgi:hypothetical protein